MVLEYKYQNCRLQDCAQCLWDNSELMTTPLQSRCLSLCHISLGTCFAHSSHQYLFCTFFSPSLCLFCCSLSHFLRVLQTTPDVFWVLCSQAALEPVSVLRLFLCLQKEPVIGGCHQGLKWLEHCLIPIWKYCAFRIWLG